MTLDIISPENILFTGEITSVTLPGKKGAFTVLENHAPLISSLEKGSIHVISEQKEQMIAINSGFIEVKNNVITVCVE